MNRQFKPFFNSPHPHPLNSKSVSSISASLSYAAMPHPLNNPTFKVAFFSFLINPLTSLSQHPGHHTIHNVSQIITHFLKTFKFQVSTTQSNLLVFYWLHSVEKITIMYCCYFNRDAVIFRVFR
jgi:hypothetical protein